MTDRRQQGGCLRHEKSPNLPFFLLPLTASNYQQTQAWGQLSAILFVSTDIIQLVECGWSHYKMWGTCSFATLDRWHIWIEEWWTKKPHWWFIQQDPPLWGVFFWFHHYSLTSSIHFCSFPPSPSLTLQYTQLLMNTHTPTQAVRNHKTCCSLSCSDDNLLATRRKRFSQPIRKLIRQRGGVSSESFWGFRQKYQRKNSQL